MYANFIVPCISIWLSLVTANTADLTNYCQKREGSDEFDLECSKNTQSHFSRKRYILYDVNPPEGFNLRRDVYVRAAMFVKHLIKENKEYEWQLVLPPWGNLYHWQSRDVGSQSQLPWGLFFDISSLKKYVPVLEMYEFLEEYPSNIKETVLDCVYFLQNDDNMFKTGKFVDKNEIVRCPEDDIPYEKVEDGTAIGFFWNFFNITTRRIECVIFHGTTLGLQINLQPNKYRSVMFDHMEIPLHYSYGSKDYWKARRSMRYNTELYQIANKFRKTYLKSSDVDDNTELPHDWTKETKRRNAVGGPYLSVHLRRRDFIVSRSTSTPTIKSVALQIRTKMESLKLNILFVATDSNDEYEELKKYLNDYEVLKFSPSKYVKDKFKDGGVAIIDQIICSYARYFIGTHESTFTYRIQENREILGFPAEATFSRLCKENICSADGRWEIVW